MLTIICHWLRNNKVGFVFFVTLMVAAVLASSSQLYETRDFIIHQTIIWSMIYSGILFLNLIFSEIQQGSIFLLLASPCRRMTIYLGNVLAALLNLIALLALQLLVVSYKNFGSELFWHSILPEILPGLFYQSLTNVLLFGSFCLLIGQWMRPALNRWMIALVVIYSIVALIYLATHDEGIRMLSTGQLQWYRSLLFGILDVIFYQHLIFLADAPTLRASLFLLGSVVVFAVSGFLFVRRDFHPE